MQLSDLTKKFLLNLGYPATSIVRPIRSGKQQEREGVLPDFLVVDTDSKKVLCLIAISESLFDDDIELVGKQLEEYSKAHYSSVEQYIIGLNREGKIPGEQVVFFGFDSLAQEFLRIPVDEFPEYLDLLVSHHTRISKKSHNNSIRLQKSLVIYFSLLALVFLGLVIGDVYVERVLDMSYLNLQRTILLVAAASSFIIPFCKPSR